MSNIIQRQFLESLVVERMTSSENVNVLLDGFTNETNSGLSRYLKDGDDGAGGDDANNSNAVYIIRTSDNTLELLKNEMDMNLSQNFILLYFALRPGLLYEPLFQDNPISKNWDMCRFVESYLSESNVCKKKKMFKDYLKKHPGVKPKKIKYLIDDYKINSKLCGKNCKSLNMYPISSRISYSFSLDTHKRVSGAVGAIELVLFCANQSPCVKDLYNNLCFDYPMGGLFYWYFIFPIILSTIDLIGGQYVYLFAADNSLRTNMEHTLVEYYEQYLNFTTNRGLSTVKPIFDYGCIFMWQEINAVKDYYLDLRQELLQDTESDADAILI